MDLKIFHRDRDNFKVTFTLTPSNFSFALENMSVQYILLIKEIFHASTWHSICSERILKFTKNGIQGVWILMIYRIAKMGVNTSVNKTGLDVCSFRRNKHHVYCGCWRWRMNYFSSEDSDEIVALEKITGSLVEVWANLGYA